jgi:hypothetical protein
MLKFIESPDLHADPRWPEIVEMQFDAIIKAARENEVDFVTFPGDLFNKPFVATDKGGVNLLRRKMRELVAVCPVVAIEGTPGHEPKGSYGFLQDVGLVLLEPGKEYFVHENRNILCTKSANPQAIIFGIPELNTEHILADKSLSAEEANRSAENLLENYIDEFVAPNRARYPGIPAVGLLHGVVSDVEREHSTDRIVRSSRILVRTEVLQRANLTRWSFGDQHIPWESDKIFGGYAGYAGMDDHVWNYLDFVPAMNLIVLDFDAEHLTRIPYGLPERRKIYRPLAEYEPNVAYWLETDDETATVPGGHPWSRLTYKPKPKSERRVVQTEKELTLAELFRIYKPDVSDSIIAKVETLSKSVKPVVTEPIAVSVLAVEVFGSIFWRGGHIKYTPDAPGLVGVGGDMGDGKSAMLSFLTPYPVVVGKDTESGRNSAIKEFFNTPDARIEKIVSRNGIEHRHVIQIKGAHTNSASTQCYLYIDGANQLETTSFDEMFAKCEALYGSFEDYLLTTFYVQPLQSKQGSSLMSATKTDAGKVVQAIAGVDREAESRSALDRVADAKKQVEAKESWIAGATEFMTEPAELEATLKTQEAGAVDGKKALDAIEVMGKSVAERVAALQTAKTTYDAEKQRKATDAARGVEIDRRKSSLSGVIDRLESNRAELKVIETHRATSLKNQELKNAYDAAVLAWNSKLEDARKKVRDLNTAVYAEQRAWDTELANAKQAATQHNQEQDRNYQNATADYYRRKNDLESVIARNKLVTVESCPECGYIAPDAQERLTAAKDAIAEAEQALSAMSLPSEATYIDVPVALNRQRAVPFTEPDTIPDQLPTQPVYATAPAPSRDESQVRAEIQSAESAQAEIAALNSEFARLSAQTYNIDETVPERLSIAQNEHARLKTEYSDARDALATVNANIESTKRAIAEAVKRQGDIDAARAELVALRADLEEWQAISQALQAKNIPAMELEISLDAIDNEATRILSPFQAGRYTVRTDTTGKFDIMIYDAETALETSLFARNPGHKSFFSDAYVKALIRRRNERQHRSYDPIIYDEADAPVGQSHLAAYYQVQESYFQGSGAHVLVVSHKGSEYIKNVVDVKELY